MKRLVIIIPIVLVVIGIAIALFAYFSGSKGPASLRVSGAGASSTTAQGAQVPVSQVLSNLPQGPLLTLGTPQGSVQVKNFYSSDPNVDGDGDILLATTADYFISYSIPGSSFWIAVSGASFDTIRPEAEAVFLSTLGVSEADACKLDVTEGVPYAPNNPLDGKSFPLSFCPAKM